MNVSELVKAGMKKQEAEVFVRFAEAVRLAAKDEAIRKGTTYDLGYCNFSSDGFNKDKHYVFLRDYEDHTLLIAANFSPNDAVMKIIIPEHAFEWMEIPSNDQLYPGKIIEVSVKAMDASIITLI